MAHTRTHTIITAASIAGILICAIGIIGLMAALGTKATAKDPNAGNTLVDVSSPKRPDRSATISATGTVEASQSIVLSPQVSGAVIYIAPKLSAGGRFKKGEVLARIDPRDYQAQLTQAEASLQQAQLTVTQEKARRNVAEREWALLGESASEEQAALALRKPQLAAAVYNEKSAQAALDRAKLSLERTYLRAPFNAVVVSESIDVGQLVGTQTQAVQLIGTDRAWVNVTVPIEALAWIRSQDDAGKDASVVEIRQDIGAQGSITRQGRVLRLGAQLDAATRRASLLVEIDPTTPADDNTLPLLPGAFVHVDIAAIAKNNTWQLPALALHQDREMWRVDAQNRLEIVPVSLAWRGENYVLVEGPLSETDRIIESPISIPLSGMPLHIANPAKQDAPQEPQALKVDGEAP